MLRRRMLRRGTWGVTCGLALRERTIHHASLHVQGHLIIGHQGTTGRRLDACASFWALLAADGDRKKRGGEGSMHGTNPNRFV